MKKEAFNEYRISSSHTYDEMREIILNACQNFDCIMSKRQCEREGERELILYYYNMVRLFRSCPDRLLVILSECKDGGTTVTAFSIPLHLSLIRYRYCSHIMEKFIKNMGNAGKGERVYLTPGQKEQENEGNSWSLIFAIILIIINILVIIFVK